MIIRNFLLALTCIFLLNTTCLANEIEYQRIQKLLVKYCAGCHNATESEGDFSVESFDTIMRGGENGKVITPGSSASSRLNGLLQRTIEPSMPPEGEPFPSAEEKQLIADWIDSGAPGPGNKPHQFRLTTPIIPSHTPIRPITALAVDGNGKLVAKGSFGIVTLSARDSKIQREVKLPGKVNALTLSQTTGKLYAATGVTGLRGSIVEIDLQSATITREFTGHTDICYQVDVSSDGARMISTSYDRTAIVWDLKKGSQLAKLTGHNGAVFDAEFAPNEHKHNVATASADGTIKIWDEQGNRLDTRSEPLKELNSTAFHPSGEYFVGGGDDNRIRKWAFQSHSAAATNELLISRFAHKSAIQFVEFKPDGSMLASVSKNGIIKFWDPTNLTELGSQNTQNARVASLAVSDQQVILGLFNGKLKTVDWPAVVAKGNIPNSLLHSRAPHGTYGTVGESRPFPEPIDEVEPNNIATPHHVRLPFVVQGAISGDSGSDHDVFSFDATEGEVVIFETRARQIKSPADTKIEVLREDGSAIPRVKLRAVRDSYFTFRGKNSTQTNDFRLHNWEEMQIGQLLYCNGEVVRLYHYPRGPDSGFNVFPNFGKRHTLFDTTPVSHALNEPCFVVEAFPPNTKLPATGLPELLIHYENDDDSSQQKGPDSRLTFTAPETGRFLIRVTDSRSFQGDSFRYELIGRKPQPRFEIVGIQNAKPKIAKGTHKRIGITIQRIDGFNEPVLVRIEGLPAGFSAPGPTTIEPDQLKCWIPLHANDDVAPPEASEHNPTIVAESKLNGKEIEKIKPLGPISLVKQAKLKVQLHGDKVAADGIPVVTIRAGETRKVRLSVERISHKSRINFGKEDAAINAPFGIFVNHTGLNGVLLPPNRSQREFFLTAEPFVKPMERLIFVEAQEADRPASNPIRLIVLPPKH